MLQFLENSCTSIQTIYFTEDLYLAVSCRSHLGGPMGMRSLLWTIRSHAFCSVSSCDSRYLLADTNRFNILAVFVYSSVLFSWCYCWQEEVHVPQGRWTGVLSMFTLFAPFLVGQYMFTLFSVLPAALLLGYPWYNFYVHWKVWCKWW